MFLVSKLDKIHRALFDHRVAIHHHGLLHSHNPPPVRAILGQVDAAIAAGAQGSRLAEVVAVEDVFVHLRFAKGR